MTRNESEYTLRNVATGDRHTHTQTQGRSEIERKVWEREGRTCSEGPGPESNPGHCGKARARRPGHTTPTP